MRDDDTSVIILILALIKTLFGFIYLTKIKSKLYYSIPAEREEKVKPKLYVVKKKSNNL
jgi:hypothetical protein